MDDGSKRRETKPVEPEEGRRARTDLFSRTLDEKWVETEPGVYRLVEDLLDALPGRKPREDVTPDSDET